MEQNKEAFTQQAIKLAWAYFEGSMDEKLSTRLATLRNDKGEKKITDATAIAILGHIEELYQDTKPLWVQQMNYFKATQSTNETFEDFWA